LYSIRIERVYAEARVASWLRRRRWWHHSLLKVGSNAYQNGSEKIDTSLMTRTRISKEERRGLCDAECFGKERERTDINAAPNTIGPPNEGTRGEVFNLSETIL